MEASTSSNVAAAPSLNDDQDDFGLSPEPCTQSAYATSALFPQESTRPIRQDLVDLYPPNGVSFPFDQAVSRPYWTEMTIGPPTNGGGLDSPSSIYLLYGPYIDYEDPSVGLQETAGTISLRCSDDAAGPVELIFGWIFMTASNPLVSTDWTDVDTPEGLDSEDSGETSVIVRIDPDLNSPFVYNLGPKAVEITNRRATSNPVSAVLTAGRWAGLSIEGTISEQSSSASSQDFVQYVLCMVEYAKGSESNCER